MLPRTPFGSSSTGDDVAAAVDLSGQHAIITGVACGLDVETGRVLAGRGADVMVAAQDLSAGERAAAEIRELTGNPMVHAGQLDLADRWSIHRFLTAWTGPLDILVNNAEVPAPPQPQYVPGGWELQFAANFLGHFELTVGLFDALAAAAQGARVVSVSSSAHLFCPVVFDDINFRYRPYDPLVANGQSKTAAILLAVAISTQWASAGIVANAVNPGAVTGTLEHVDGAGRALQGRRKTVQQGAATTILAAVSPLLGNIGGRYLEDCNEARVADGRTEELTGVAPYAIDPDNAERLWAHAARSL